MFFVLIFLYLSLFFFCNFWTDQREVLGGAQWCPTLAFLVIFFYWYVIYFFLWGSCGCGARIISVYFHFFRKKNCTPCCGKMYSLNQKKKKVKFLTEPKNCNIAPLNIKVINLVWVLTQPKKKSINIIKMIKVAKWDICNWPILKGEKF